MPQVLVSSTQQDSHKDRPECVMFSSAPVAFLCTRMSFERARRVRGTKAPDLAILDLLSSGYGVNKHLSPLRK